MLPSKGGLRTNWTLDLAPYCQVQVPMLDDTLFTVRIMIIGMMMGREP